MERKIGETFEYKGKIYKVAEMPEYFCAFCDLEKECSIQRSYLENVAGTCRPSDRADVRNVCFKEIKKDMEIKDNKLTINIPEGMEIDVENSDLKKGIIKFKSKELTYVDIMASLDSNTKLIPTTYTNCEKVIAISKLMDIADYYNKGWKPDWNNKDKSKFYIAFDTESSFYTVKCGYMLSYNIIYFKNRKDAQAVIDNPNFREILNAIYKD